MRAEQIIRDYHRNEGVYAAMASWADGALRWLREDPTYGVHDVSHRIKTAGSLEQKLRRPDLTYGSIAEVTDVLGFRVITYFEDAITPIVTALEDRLQVDYGRSVDKSDALGASRFGYKSVHLICRGPAEITLLDLDAGPAPIHFEIQLRTVLQHAWAEIEHDLGYKSPQSIPLRIRRKFSRVASLLEIADDEFVGIRKGLEDYEGALRSGRGVAWEAMEVDKVSLTYLVQGAPARGLDREVAALLHKPEADEPFHPEYLVRVLQAAGLTTFAAIREACQRHQPQLAAFVPAYFEFTRSRWRFGPADVDAVRQGYGLLFVAYMVALGDEALGQSQVKRATRLMQKTDGLDHEEARGAARDLVRRL